MDENKKYPGTLIVIEGIDGAGKTAVSELMFQELQKRLGTDKVIRMRTPDGPIRHILLQRPYTLTDTHELLLFAACHATVIQGQMLPALEAGKTVVCDRFIHSTLSYQGFGRKLLSEATTLIDEYLKPPKIDHLIFVDAEQQICDARLESRGNKDFLDSEAKEFKQRVRNGLLTLMEYEEKTNPRLSRIRNNGTLEDLNDILRSWMNHYYPIVSEQKFGT